MAITYHPRVGQILLCDFSQGFKEPEMVKSGRPVIVLSTAPSRASKLVTIVPLSTVKPDKIMPYHYQLPRNCMPQLGMFQRSDSWVKGDLLYTVGFHRLELIRLNKKNPTTGKRMYFKYALSRDRMKEIYSCVLHGMSLGHLTEHI